MKWFSEKPETDIAQTNDSIGFDGSEVRLGDLMRGERATLGKSLLDVQRELHIRATYIAAIEAADLSAFEATSFIAGYVRSYARYLGMDPDWCYAKFCQETGFAVKPDLTRAPSALPTRIPDNRNLGEGLLSRTKLAQEPDPFWRRVDVGAVGSLAVVLTLIGGLGYGAWVFLQEVQRVNLVPADQPPEVMADLDPVMSGAATRLADTDNVGLRVGQTQQTASAAQGVVRPYRPEPLDTPVMVARDGPIAAINPRPETVPGPDLSDAISLALAEASGDVRVTSDGPPQLEVLAVRPSWIRVRAADGTVLFEKVLDAGERFVVPASEEAPTLRAGNSGSVYLLVDGQPFGPTAPGAQVIDRVVLSPDAVTERFAEADLSGDRDLQTFIAVAEASQ
jgi:cytoskeletal protein RodZ